MMKTILFSLSASFVLSGVICPAVHAQPAKASITVSQIIGQAKREESKIQTGAVRLTEVITHTPQNDEEVKALYGDFAGGPQMERETPRESHGERTLLFDNRRGALLLESRDDNKTLALRAFLDKTITKSYLKLNSTHASDKAISYVPQCVVSGPQASLNDYNALLTSRFWRDANITNARLTSASASAALLELPERYGRKTVLELDPRQHYAVKALRVIDTKTGRLFSQMAITRRPQNGVWFPAKITQTTYNVGAAADKKTIDTTETVVQSADLNLPLAERDLAFGPIPFGAVVTDARFNPPLVYNQGTRQFTDAELQNFSKNPDALSRANAYTPAEFARLQQELEAQKASP